MHDARDLPDTKMMAIYARMSAAQKLAIVDGLVRSTRRLTAEGVKAQHPDWSEPQVRREVARRTLASGSDGDR